MQGGHRQEETAGHPLIGTIVGGYRVVRELARGGMGVVFEATHASLGQRAAVKILSDELLQDPKYKDYYARFFNEARAITVIQHPGIVKIYDHGQLPTGTAFILMEFLEGESLERRISRGAPAPDGWMPVPSVLRITRQLASALAEAHRKSIIHRDLKPANVMLVPDPEAAGEERTKLLDFGIARFLDSPHRRTAAGTIMGTPPYMSPEQCMSKDVTSKTDVYSLGVMMYEMLSGRLPFDGTATAILVLHVSEPPPELQAIVPAVPKEVCQLVHRMLAKDAKQRPTMAEVVNEVRQLERTLPAAASSEKISQTDPTSFLPVRRPGSDAATRLITPKAASRAGKLPLFVILLTGILLLAAGAGIWFLR